LGTNTTAFGLAIALCWSWVTVVVLGWYFAGVSISARPVSLALDQASKFYPKRIARLQEYQKRPGINYTALSRRIPGDAERVGPFYNYAKVFVWSHLVDQLIRTIPRWIEEVQHPMLVPRTYSDRPYSPHRSRRSRSGSSDIRPPTAPDIDFMPPTRSTTVHEDHQGHDDHGYSDQSYPTHKYYASYQSHQSAQPLLAHAHAHAQRTRTESAQDEMSSGNRSSMDSNANTGQDNERGAGTVGQFGEVRKRADSDNDGSTAGAGAGASASPIKPFKSIRQHASGQYIEVELKDNDDDKTRPKPPPKPKAQAQGMTGGEGTETHSPR
jgi:hypothetical protein